jgi:hypothetical protein
MNLKLIVFFFGILCLTKHSLSQLCAQVALDLVLAIDSSGSIGASNFNIAKSALVSMIDKLNIGPTKVRVGIINYSSNFFKFKILIININLLYSLKIIF